MTTIDIQSDLCDIQIIKPEYPIPVEVIAYISTFMEENILRLTNKEVYNSILEDEEGWKKLYMDTFKKNMVYLSPLNKSLNWKLEYCRIRQKNYFEDIITTPLYHILTNDSYITLVERNLNYIPKELGNETNLIMLDISHNKIKVYPKELCNLIKLIRLEIKDNLISHIPKEFENYIELLYLDMSQNQIAYIPDEIFKLNKLKKLFLEGIDKIKKEYTMKNDDLKIYF